MVRTATLRLRATPAACLTCLVGLALCLSAVTAADFPSDLQRCGRNDPEFQTCLKNSINAALKALKNGLPALNVPPLDPMFVKEAPVVTGAGPIQLKFLFTNSTVRGFEDGTIDQAKFDYDKKQLHLECSFPKVSLEGHYKLDGRFLLLPARGEGPYFNSLSRNKVVGDFQFVEETKDGQKYLKVNNAVFKVTPGHLTFNFENLLGDKRVGDALNKAMNDNWKAMGEALMPPIEKVLTSIMSDYTNTLFSQIPEDVIFPETA